MSLNRFKNSAILLFGFLIKAYEIKHGKRPKIVKSIIPGIRKSEKGESAKIDNGNPPSSLPEGEMINAPPPPMALNPRNNNNEIRTFLAEVGLIVVFF